MKPLTLRSTNGLYITPEETVRLFLLLETVAFEELTQDDRLFATQFLIRAAATFPEYADLRAGKPSAKTPMRPDQRKPPYINNRHNRNRR